MPFLEGGAWRMTGHWQYIGITGGALDTGKFTVHRTSPTP